MVHIKINAEKTRCLKNKNKNDEMVRRGYVIQSYGDNAKKNWKITIKILICFDVDSKSYAPAIAV